jgi:hypothetical protein
MFNSAQQLKFELTNLDAEQFFDTHLTSGGSKYFSDEKIEYFCRAFSENFDLQLNKDSVVMVGSAKLGFALHEKKTRNQPNLSAFRPYGPDSDVDLAVCDSDFFRKIWYELSAHACLQNYCPWNHKKLADYLIYGWLRPDQFPKDRALTHCDRFYQTLGSIRRDRKNGHPKLSVALYYSHEQLKRYQSRSIALCKDKLGL